MKFIPESLQRDVLVLMAFRGVRAFAFSYLSVVFAIYLDVKLPEEQTAKPQPVTA